MLMAVTLDKAMLASSASTASKSDNKADTDCKELKMNSFSSTTNKSDSTKKEKAEDSIINAAPTTTITKIDNKM